MSVNNEPMDRIKLEFTGAAERETLLEGLKMIVTELETYK